MEKKESKMAKDKLGMEPAVHRKELEKKIKSLEEDVDTLISKVNQICTRMGLSKL